MSNPNVLKINMPIEELQASLNQILTSDIIIVDEREFIVSCSQAFLREVSFSEEELQGFALSEVVNLESSVVEYYLRQFTTAETGSLQLTAQLKRKNGMTVDKRTIIFCIEANRKSYYLLVLLEPLDKRGLSLLQQFAGTFLRDVNLGVILINTDFRLIDISDMACRVLGVRRDQIINKSMEEVFAAVPIEHQLVQRTILDGVVVRNHAISWTNNQERHELLMDSNLLKDHNGKIVGVYVIFKDVSNLRSLEEQVQRSDRLAMIGQIAAGTAHEIRNPLTSIKGFLQVMKKTMMDTGMEKEYGYTEIMLKEIDRINDLVSEFLLLSKPKNVVYDLVNISTTLSEIVPIINNEAILHNVSVEYEPVSDLPFVVADRELLKQVFLNISKNGIEAMIEGGLLTISEWVDFKEQKVNVDIRDTGPGIPVFLIDKIFDPFFTTKDKGTGLGLSVCQRIIHDIGGSIRVASKGFGTTFTVSIPFRLSAAPFL